jgi:hypothetical protein
MAKESPVFDRRRLRNEWVGWKVDRQAADRGNSARQVRAFHFGGIM